MPGNEEQREARHGVCAGQITKENNSHVRQGISFTLFLREEGVCGIESTRGKKKKRYFCFGNGIELLERKTWPLYVFKEKKKRRKVQTSGPL